MVAMKMRGRDVITDIFESRVRKKAKGLDIEGEKDTSKMMPRILAELLEAWRNHQEAIPLPPINSKLAIQMKLQS